MFINQQFIKICFNESDSPERARLSGFVMQKQSSEQVISLKYTIDYPRMQLHPFDTSKFTIYYADNKVDAKYDMNRCIEMIANSRQSRDLIALLIKCFSAQTYFVNSKIIQDVVDNNGNPYAQNKDADAGSGMKLFQVSDVLMELEFVKRELYNQINLTEKLDKEKQGL